MRLSSRPEIEHEVNSKFLKSSIFVSGGFTIADVRERKVLAGRGC